MTRYGSWVLALLAAAAAAGSAWSAPVGMAYLKIGTGADAIAMGEAVVSNVDGPGATYWNPGALAFLTGVQAGVVHNNSFQQIRQEFAGAVRQVGRFGVGAVFHGTWTQNIDAYDDTGNAIGTFSYYGFALGASAGYRLNDTWGAGMSLNYLREALDVYSTSGEAIDLGVQGRQVLPRVDVGFSILHLGSSMRYVQESFSLPLTVQGGVTYHLRLPALGSEALLAAELRKIRDENASFRFGIEYRLQQTAFLRFGYRSALDTEDVSFGIGLRHGVLQADYAYVPFGSDLGSQHRIGLTYRK